jgi:hypothetical protein
MSFEGLDRDLIIKIALTLDLDNILSYCLVSKKFNKLVCENKKFWVSKLYQDYKIRYLDISPDRSGDPKEYYKFFSVRRPSTNLYIINAAEENRLNILKYLLSKYPDENYLTPFEIAVTNNSMDVIKYFVENYLVSLNFGMARASSAGHLDTVKYFVDKGATHFHWALKLAIKGRHKDIVDYLKTKL